MKLGFIGAGNMGGAIIGGIINNNLAAPEDVIITDADADKARAVAERFGAKTAQSGRAAAEACDMLFLCVKPNVVYTVVEEIKDAVRQETIVVSIVAGQSLDKLEAAFGNDIIKLARVMPNTPALVGEGMAAVTPNKNMTEEDTEAVVRIFNGFGKTEVVPEKLMDTVTAVSGSSPAYVFMFIEAMADAAVQGGMPRAQAYTFAAQSVLGSAKMVLDTAKHPGELKDMVCSPGGTTIDAVAVLEEEGMRNAVIKAMKACIDKSRSM